MILARCDVYYTTTNFHLDDHGVSTSSKAEKKAPTPFRRLFSILFLGTMLLGMTGLIERYFLDKGIYPQFLIRQHHQTLTGDLVIKLRDECGYPLEMIRPSSGSGILIRCKPLWYQFGWTDSATSRWPSDR